MGGRSRNLVCVRMSGTFRARFRPERSGEVHGKFTIDSWDVKVYRVDLDANTASLQTAAESASMLRSMEFLPPPREGVMFGTLSLDSGRGSGGLGAGKFSVEWEVTFPPLAAADTSPPVAAQDLETADELVLKTDHPRYLSGQRLVLGCRLTRFERPRGTTDLEERRRVEDVDNFSLILAFRFPKGEPVTLKVPREALHLLGDGNVVCVPLAPIVAGEYTIEGVVSTRPDVSCQLR